MGAVYAVQEVDLRSLAMPAEACVGERDGAGRWVRPEAQGGDEAAGRTRARTARSLAPRRAVPRRKDGRDPVVCWMGGVEGGQSGEPHPGSGLRGGRRVTRVTGNPAEQQFWEEDGGSASATLSGATPGPSWGRCWRELGAQQPAPLT